MELTESQKAQAFDAGMTWISQEIARLRKITDDPKAVLAAVLTLQELKTKMEQAAESAQPQQAENMPPDGLDLSQHVGKTAVLWNNQAEAIFSSTERDKGKYPFIIDGCRYTQNGFYSSCEAPTELNVKTILP